MLGKVSSFCITESCIKVRNSITTDYVTGASRFIGSYGSGSGKNEPRNSPLSPVQTEATVLANDFQHCWLLYVASVCTPVACCCVLLGVVAQSLKPVKLLAPCKRTQHCWPTTPNIVGCYMLRPFAHPVACCCVLLGVVAQSLKPIRLLATCKRTQQLPTLLANNVGSCCVCLHAA